MPDVRLVDLQLIRRYSVAIRQETADAAELLEVLEADRAALQQAVKGRRAPARRTSRSTSRSTTRGATSRATTSRATTSRATTTKASTGKRSR